MPNYKNPLSPRREKTKTDGVSKDIQDIFAAMGQQPWYKLRIRTGGKNDGK